MWQTMDTYLWPVQEWDYDHPQTLVYAPDVGIRIARCILSIDDYSDDSPIPRYSFTYDRDGWEIQPTHWMPLPSAPE